MGDEIEIADACYRWQEVAVHDAEPTGWAHHDVQPLKEGGLVTAHPDGHRLVLIDGSGRQSVVDTDLTEFHGLTVSDTSGAEHLWVSDIGHEMLPAEPRYAARRTRGRVVELDLAGRLVNELPQPDIEAYAETGWMPCATAIEPGDSTTSPTVWVADGYAKSLLHRFDTSGTLLATVDGSQSGLAFETPHSVIVDSRRGTPELYVADRGNARVVVLDLSGQYLRTVGEGVLTSPSGFAVSGDLLFVAELFGSVAVLDRDDALVARIGDCAVHDRPGWPNALVEDVVAPPPLQTGCFNSPHGIGVDEDGSVYVSEWLIGGRLVKLARV